MLSLESRTAGLLLHITSLPCSINGDHEDAVDFGVGDMGSAAFGFVDFLKQSGQSIWQVLPTGPTLKGDSPYSCYSAFAGGPLLISAQALVKDGWLDRIGELDGSPSAVSTDASKVDFANANNLKQRLLTTAFEQSRDCLAANSDFDSFCESSGWWLDDFALFEALMAHFETQDWTQWPTELVQRDAAELKKWEEKLSDQILRSKFVQFVFEEQWSRLKSYANENGVRLFGDIPIFVAHESADVWANQELFHLNDCGQPTLVAGVPPDYFSESGQLWGNPLYNWDVMESKDFHWWTQRFRRSLEHFDMVRIDHFRGFEAYWEIPATAQTAVEGAWKAGPLSKPFEAAHAVLASLPVVAEDLGLITPAVEELRKKLGFPTMRVMQFGYDNEHDDFHRPETYPENCVAYTGTHDNETVMGWFDNRRLNSIVEHKRDDILGRNLNCGQEIHWQLIKILSASQANTVIAPVQDVLGLGNEARMNVPGEAKGNWHWRLRSKKLTSEIESTLLKIAKETSRA